MQSSLPCSECYMYTDIYAGLVACDTFRTIRRIEETDEDGVPIIEVLTKGNDGKDTVIARETGQTVYGGPTFEFFDLDGFYHRENGYPALIECFADGGVNYGYYIQGKFQYSASLDINKNRIVLDKKIQF